MASKHQWQFDISDLHQDDDCAVCGSCFITYDGKHMLCPNAAAEEIEALRSRIVELEKLLNATVYHQWMGVTDCGFHIRPGLLGEATWDSEHWEIAAQQEQNWKRKMKNMFHVKHP